jgi:hypothetical protein
LGLESGDWIAIPYLLYLLLKILVLESGDLIAIPYLLSLLLKSCLLLDRLVADQAKYADGETA